MDPMAARRIAMAKVSADEERMSSMNATSAMASVSFDPVSTSLSRLPSVTPSMKKILPPIGERELISRPTPHSQLDRQVTMSVSAH